MRGNMESKALKPIECHWRGSEDLAQAPCRPEGSSARGGPPGSSEGSGCPVGRMEFRGQLRRPGITGDLLLAVGGEVQCVPQGQEPKPHGEGSGGGLD